MHDAPDSSPLFSEVQQRFGLLPNFFRFAAKDISITEGLWGFAKLAYLDNPLPSLFKERLFVYLSRFCPVQYCFVRHLGFLLGLGHASGDKDVFIQKIEDVLPMLKHPLPAGVAFNEIASICDRYTKPIEQLPTANTPEEFAIFDCAAHLFLKTAEMARAQRALTCVLGKQRLEYVNLLLAFVRTAHYWTELNPTLEFEPDIQQLFAAQQVLAESVLGNSDSSAYKINSRILQEINSPETLQQEHRDLLRDIESRKQTEQALRESEERQAFLLKFADTLRPLTNPVEVQKAAMKLLVEQFNVMRATYFEVDPDQDTFTLTARYEQDAAPIPERMRLSDFAPEMSAAYRAGRTLIFCDTETDTQLGSQPSAYRPISICAWAAVPLIKEGQLLAIVGLHSRTPHNWTATEIQLLEDVADRTWSTVERARAEEALRQSKEQLNLALDATQLGTFIWHVKEDRGEPDARMLALFDQPPDGTLTLRDAMATMIHPEDGPRYAAAVAEASLPNGSRRLREDIRIRRTDGGWRWVAITAKISFDEAGEPLRMAGIGLDITERKRAEEALRESEERQAFLLKLSDALRTVGSSREIQQVASRMLGERFGVNRALYAEIDGEGDTADAVINGQFVQGVAPVPDRVNYKLFTDGFPGELWRQGLPVLVEDSETDPRFLQPVREAWRTINTRASLAVPLIKDGREVVIFGLHNAMPRAWTQADVSFLTEAIERTWAATERALAEDALRQSEEKYRTLFETMDQGYEEIELIRNAENEVVDYKMVLTNPAYERIVGIPADKVLNRPVQEALPGIDPWWLETFTRIAVEGVAVRFEREEPVVGRWFDLHVVPRGGDRLLVLFDNITDRKRSEEGLRASEERFRLFVENVREYAFVQTDFEGIITSWNPGAERLFGYTSEETIGKPFVMLLPVEDRNKGIIAREMAKLSEGKRNEDSYTVQRKDGSRFWAEWITEPVLDDNGRLRGTAKVMRDETDRQQADKAIRTSLIEKEALLSEVHHRVKNNLQVITSLLNLQTRGLKDRETVILFNETRNRVSSIASIHEMLYRSKSFAAVDLLAYARQIAPALVNFYGAQSRVQTVIEGTGASLDLERAVPFGLLLNELTSNALKHGFAEAKSGILQIALSRQDNDILLEVNDNGKGLPIRFLTEQESTLGLRLVRILVRQLRGEIEFHSTAGTQIAIRFPAHLGASNDERNSNGSLSHPDR